MGDMTIEAPKTTPKHIYSNVTADYDIVVVGSGPGGLSAAARCAQIKAKHVLLEAESHASDTIYKYQKGKHVMAEPSILPLRSHHNFKAGKRESVLGTWDKELEELGVNIAYGKKVNGINKDEATGVFKITCEDGSSMTSRSVILGIGLQGNIRKLGVEGESLERVQYTLADPEEFKGETIVVIGAGDAGIENALGLADSGNKVFLFNRSDEFPGVKDGNIALITDADKNGSVKIHYRTSALKVVETGAEPPLMLHYNGPDGEGQIPCHRMICRLGAIPPRKLVESFGIVFPSPSPVAIPVLSESYESNVKGLYIVGALGGYPLIKQAMNQGHDVVDTLMGLPVVPVDEVLLKEKIKHYKPNGSVGEVLDIIGKNVPLFGTMSKLQLREFLLDSTILTPKTGDVIFKKNDYTNTFFSIVEGVAEVDVEGKDGKTIVVKLTQGQYFGEMGLISGRRRSATIRAGQGCVLLETPRKAMLKLMASVEDVNKKIDESFIRRAISTHLAPQLSYDAITELMAGGLEAKKYNARQVIFKQGDTADGLYLIRRGSATVSNIIGGKEVVLSYVTAGNYVGEMALLSDAPRSATVTATVLTEVLVLNAETFKTVLAKNPQWRAAIEAQVMKRVKTNVVREDSGSGDTDLINFLMKQGLGEATDVLIIDESLCVQCNNCETACAETHQGTSRLNRAAGFTYQNIHIPTSCRHCEHPHCMKDCPPDAIRRSEHGEVVISDSCIGCGNCERNCPYGVIQLQVQKPPKPGGLLSWLLFGLGAAPGKRAPDYDPEATKKAVKCDLCRGMDGGPNCVKACPTGAAVRVSPEKIIAAT
ncbi:MAG: cyclic nucleotide-binding domain-containing protein [Burkholderiales bacterium]|nr:cyclic nucleotide-binding domain-containing protein [Burkholderiales bacterium]